MLPARTGIDGTAHGPVVVKILHAADIAAKAGGAVLFAATRERADAFRSGQKRPAHAHKIGFAPVKDALRLGAAQDAAGNHDRDFSVQGRANGTGFCRQPARHHAGGRHAVFKGAQIIFIHAVPYS